MSKVNVSQHVGIKSGVLSMIKLTKMQNSSLESRKCSRDKVSTHVIRR